MSQQMEVTKLAQKRHCNREKNWLDFSGLDLIFKVTTL